MLKDKNFKTYSEDIISKITFPYRKEKMIER
jgi:hypothetical protein